MLRFIPRTEKAYTDVGIYKFHLYQGCDCGRGRPSFDNHGQTIVSEGNCQFCRYRSEWVNAPTKSTAWRTCLMAHKCQGALYPLVEMSRPLNEQWNDYIRVESGGEAYYEPSALVRQVTFEGQPLYTQFYAQMDFVANCNAFCWWHQWRLDNKRTWRQCAKTHKCWQDGSGWALMAPTDDTLFQEFCDQL